MDRAKNLPISQEARAGIEYLAAYTQGGATAIITAFESFVVAAGGKLKPTEPPEPPQNPRTEPKHRKDPIGPPTPVVQEEPSTAQPEATDEGLDALSTPALQRLAAENGIKRSSQMKRPTLLNRLKGAGVEA